MHPRHKFPHHMHRRPHSPHPFARHGGPHPFAFLGGALMLFVLFTLIANGGWVLFFLLPLFFYGAKGRFSHSWGCTPDADADSKAKNDDKPKRRVVETADGTLLEVIDEPQQV